MISLKQRLQGPLILSFCATFFLHILFFVGICVFMTEEYYTLVSHGLRHHKRHYQKHQLPGSLAQSQLSAAIEQQSPEQEDGFVTHDLVSNTYRLSPDLLKAFKALDIVPVTPQTKKIIQQKKVEILKEKMASKLTKAVKQKEPKTHKKHADAKPLSSKKEKSVSDNKRVHAAIKPLVQKKLAPVIASPVVAMIKASSSKSVVQVKQQAGSAKTLVSKIATVVVPDTQRVQKSTTSQPITPVPAHKNVSEQTYDEEDANDVLLSNAITQTDDDAYDDDDEGTDDGAPIVDTDTLIMAGTQASGGKLSSLQSSAAKKLSEHLVKQWKPPAGCRDATPVEVEITVQYDGRVATNIIRNSSMPILNFSVKRNLAQFTSKAVQEMLEHARGTKLKLIFKG